MITISFCYSESRLSRDSELRPLSFILHPVQGQAILTLTCTAPASSWGASTVWRGQGPTAEAARCLWGVGCRGGYDRAAESQPKLAGVHPDGVREGTAALLWQDNPCSLTETWKQALLIWTTGCLKQSFISQDHLFSLHWWQILSLCLGDGLGDSKCPNAQARVLVYLLSDPPPWCPKIQIFHLDYFPRGKWNQKAGTSWHNTSGLIISSWLLSWAALSPYFLAHYFLSVYVPCSLFSTCQALWAQAESALPSVGVYCGPLCPAPFPLSPASMKWTPSGPPFLGRCKFGFPWVMFWLVEPRGRLGSRQAPTHFWLCLCAGHPSALLLNQA